MLLLGGGGSTATPRAKQTTTHKPKNAAETTININIKPLKEKPLQEKNIEEVTIPDEGYFEYDIENINKAPYFTNTIPTITATEDTLIEKDITNNFYDDDTYTVISSNDPRIRVDGTKLQLYGLHGWPDSINTAITLSDGINPQLDQDTTQIKIIYQERNDKPVVSLRELCMNAGDSLTINLKELAEDEESPDDSLKSSSSLPRGHCHSSCRPGLWCSELDWAC